MTIPHLYYLTLLMFSMGALTAIVLRSNDRYTNYIAHGMATSGSIAAALCAILIFRQGVTVISLFSWGEFGTVSARLDYLAGFFLGLTGFLGAAASIYATGYCREYYRHRLWLMAACFNTFLLTMVLVFTINHATAFLVAWEGMSIVSFFLVIHEWEEAGNRRAAYIYLVMTHIATAFIIIAFLVLAVHAGSFEFTAFNQAHLDEGTKNIIFLCVLLGFGTKAGIMPVHVWLPRAHPVAPSHVSALMSGIMIKAAIYGLCRFFLEFIPGGPVWWGELVLALAILSCVLGVLYALMEHDLKRLLAYCSVENIGIVLLGVGAGLVFSAKGNPVPAGLAWTAALLHTLNHALLKPLLFFGAGAVMQGAHTKDMEKLGGLIHTMPYTALFFLVGAAAISGLPPFNGFVGEWLTFQSLFLLPHSLGTISGKLLGAGLVALLGLTGALAAACFVKAFGITFLAKPRTAGAMQAREAPLTMLFPMGIIAVSCLGVGIWPEPLLRVLKYVLSGYPGLNLSGILAERWFSFAVQTDVGQGMLGIPVVFGCLLLGILTALWIVHWRGKGSSRVGETWTCGIYPTERMEYTATGFSKPVRMAFKSILKPQRRKMVDLADNNYFGRRLEYHVTFHHVLTDVLYRPLHSRVIQTAQYFRRIQNGSLQLYIGYVLVVTVVGLLWSAR